MAAHDDRIAAGSVVAAEARCPYAPALLKRDGLVDRGAQHLAIGKRDVFGQRLALGRECAGLTKGATNACATIYERIEHHREELVHQLERRLLSAGGGFARKQCKRIGEIGAGEAK